MFGLIFGSLTQQIQDVEGSAGDWWTEAGGTDRIVDAYRVSIIQMAGMFVAIYLVQVLLRMRVDETDGTLEPVLASGVTRTRWLWGHVLNAVAGCVVLVVLFAVSMGLAAGQVLGGTATQVRELVWAASPSSRGSWSSAPRWSPSSAWCRVGPSRRAGHCCSWPSLLD